MTGTVEVELEDEAAGDGQGRRRAGAARAWSARAWSRGALVLAVVLAAGAALDGSVAAGLVRPADGLVTDLRVARSVLWRADTDDLLGVVGDTLVLASGSDRVVARDLADGRVRWSLAAAGCRLVDTSLEGGRAWDAVVAPAHARLLCEHMPTTQTTTVSIVDAADGGVLLSFADGRESPDVSTAGRVAVVMTTLATGSRQLSVYSLVTGDRLWGAPAQASSSDGWYVQDDALVLLDPLRAYDVDTGEAVPVPETATSATAALADGTGVRTSLEDDGAGGRTSRFALLDADGTVRWSAAGALARPVPDARTTVVPLELMGGQLEVRDLASGAVLWTRDPVDVDGEADGVLVAHDPAAWLADPSAPDPGARELVGLDARTGRELWRRPDAGGAGPVTDGRRLAVATARGVDVVSLRTGEVVGVWDLVGSAPGADATPVRERTRDETGREPLAGLLPLPGGRLAWVHDTEVVILGW